MKKPKFKAGDDVVTKGLFNHKLYVIEDPNALSPIDTLFSEPYVRLVGEKTVYAQSNFVKVNSTEEMIEWAKEGMELTVYTMATIGGGILLYSLFLKIW